MIKFDNKEAHRRIKCLENMFDHYNEHGFIEDPLVMLKVYQQSVQEALEVLKYLEEKAPDSEANNEYLFGARMISLRLSSLIHNGRVETEDEKHNFVARYI